MLCLNDFATYCQLNRDEYQSPPLSLYEIADCENEFHAEFLPVDLLIEGLHGVRRGVAVDKGS